MSADIIAQIKLECLRFSFEMTKSVKNWSIEDFELFYKSLVKIATD